MKFSVFIACFYGIIRIFANIKFHNTKVRYYKISTNSKFRSFFAEWQKRTEEVVILNTFNFKHI